jgi:hypothetical protein
MFRRLLSQSGRCPNKKVDQCGKDGKDEEGSALAKKQPVAKPIEQKFRKSQEFR